ncbi:MAG TPA: D-glycero-beta-D-manno-heptose-7-phosphate kinase [Bryobacteraceae bacterium]|nr:D-glycero-beta-D-manno-heptose-7-phosphate kinase [Bryobacteraceae bacterium]
MTHLVSRFRRATVLVAGDLMLDEYLFGTVSRVSPEAPVPVLDVKRRRCVPGGAANVAANVHSLGATVRLTGVCGTDTAGDTLCRILTEANIGDEFVMRVDGRVTTSKTRVVAGQQQIVRFDHEERAALNGAVAGVFEANLGKGLDGAGVCIVSDYGKGLLSTAVCAQLLERAIAKRIPVIVDPKGLDYSKYRGCSLITPNLKEAGEAAGIAVECEHDLYEAGKRILALLPGAAVLVTRGGDGMTLFREGEAPLTIDTVAQEVFDVVGAGDTVVAALGVALAAGLPLETATRLANVAAGIAVGKHGTVAVTADELFSHSEVALLN